jgi:hypothetical protein
MRQASRLGRIFPGALATTAPSPAVGSGAPWGRRSAIRLALISALATLALAATAATAAAAPPEAEITAFTPGFINVNVEATIDPNGTEKNVCWFFMYGAKQQIDESENPWEEEWQGVGYQCFWAEKDEATPVSIYAEHLRGGGAFYGKLWVYDGENEPVYSPKAPFTLKPVNEPITTVDSITEVTATTATFTGTIDPNAPHPASEMIDEEKDAYRTNWEFRCDPGCNVFEWGEPPTSGNGSQINAENSDLVTPVTIWGKANNLEANRVYTVYMNALNSTGSYYDFLTKAGKLTFKTLPLPPVVYYLPSAPVNTVRETSARLVGLVDKKNSPLEECYFEYGTTTAYGNTLPCAERGGDLVTGDLLGLEPDTTYHLRVVAANSAGSDTGADRTFKTLAPAEPPPTCINEGVRVEQKSTVTNKCRGWELASAADKNGGNITLENGAVSASMDGNAIVYFSRGSFADTEGSGIIGITEYMTRRGTSGWETHSMLPTPSTHTIQIGFFPGNTVVERFSDDFRKGLLGAYDLPRVDDDIVDGENMYIVNTENRNTQTITTQVPWEEIGLGRRLEYQFKIFKAGANSDMSLVSFTSQTPLLEEGGTTDALYEWEDNGEIRIASYLPDGQLAQGVEIPKEGFTSNETISRDGSLVTFTANKEGTRQLYVRRNHTDTVWVSEPEGTNTANPENVTFNYITLDNKNIIFTTTSPLVDADVNGETDLYMYTDTPDPENEANLTLISSGGGIYGEGSANPGEALLGASDDGSIVYFQDNKWNIGQIWQYKEGQRKVVFFPYGSDERRGIDVDWGSVRVSRDGKRLVMVSRASPYVPMGPGFGLNAQKTNNKMELWVYDDPTETTICASCPDYPAGTVEKPPRGDTIIKPEVIKGINVQFTLLNRPRYLTEDGKLAFFSTTEPLVPEDKNGLMDVYEYDIETGRLHLVSSGQGEFGSWFVDASANGDDVFIGTREQLIRADRDSLADVYDSRVQGGYPEPPAPPTPCVGDACRGPIPEEPAELSAATPRFGGPGNPAPKHKKKKKRRHRRGTAAKHKKGKHRATRGQHRQGGVR